jgi:hypothetical protein
MISLLVSALLQGLRAFIEPFLGYMLGKQMVKCQQVEENLELQEGYEKLDEQNKSYRDNGKSGLLERMHRECSDE